MNLTPSKTCGFSLPSTNLERGKRLEQVYGLLSLTAKSVVDIVPFNPIPATVPVAAPSPQTTFSCVLRRGKGLLLPCFGGAGRQSLTEGVN